MIRRDRRRGDGGGGDRDDAAMESLWGRDAIKVLSFGRHGGWNYECMAT